MVTVVCEYEANNIVLLGLVCSIVELEVDAIVNPANSYMIMGGGLAGVLKSKGGKVVEDEARRYAPVPIGKAVATTAGSLSAKYIIHSPTMTKPAGYTSPEYVYKATRAALKCASEKGVTSIAIPGMGTGVGGLNPCTAVREMLKAIIEYLKNPGSIKKIIVVDIKEEVPRCFCEEIKKLL